MAQMYVVKRDGSTEEVKFDTITQRLRPLCEGLDASYIDPVPATCLQGPRDSLRLGPTVGSQWGA